MFDLNMEPKNEMYEEDQEHLNVELKNEKHEEDQEHLNEMYEENEEPMNEMYEENEEQKKKIEDLEKTITEKNTELDKLKKEMNEMREKHRCELEGVDETIWALSRKERESNFELLEARRELLWLMKELSYLTGKGSNIKVKKIGELDEQIFIDACKQRAVKEHANLYWTWQQNLKDPLWHPFKRVGTGEHMKEVVDEEDEKLKYLRDVWGEEVFDAVKTAVEEINEFNPNGGNDVYELWHLGRNRKATLREGILQMVLQSQNMILKYQRALCDDYDKKNCYYWWPSEMESLLQLRYKRPPELERFRDLTHKLHREMQRVLVRSFDIEK